MVRTRGIEGYKSKLLSSKRLQPADRKKLIDKIQQNRPPPRPPQPPPISFAVYFTRMKTKTKKNKKCVNSKEN